MVAHARLYQRGDLLASLGQMRRDAGELSDPELLLTAWESRDEDVLNRINGDFAFIAWHPVERRLVAARDPFGTRPLFYRQCGPLLGLASEPRQLLELSDKQPGVDHAMLRQNLTGSTLGLGSSTLHRQIKRLLPGHVMNVENGRVRTRHYFQSGALSIPESEDRQTIQDELRRLLRRAVSERMTAAAPTGVEVSGGYDSTTVATFAAEHGLSPGGRGPLFVSQTYPGLGCDETEYIDAFMQQCGRPLIKLNALETINTLDVPTWVERHDRPDLDLGFERFEAQARVLKEHGARTLLTGLGGDELFWPPPRLRNSDKLSLKGLREMLATAVAGTAAARLPRPRSRPPWLASRWPLAIQHKPHPRYPWRPLSGESFTHYTIWSWIMKPRFLHSLEHMERQAAHAGLTVSHPMLDRELVKFVASNAGYAIGVPRDIKPLLQASMRNMLPGVILGRNRKAVFSEYFEICFARCLEPVKEALFASPQWASGQFVSREQLQGALRREPRFLCRVHGRQRVWQAMLTELWMRNCG